MPDQAVLTFVDLAGSERNEDTFWHDTDRIKESAQVGAGLRLGGGVRQVGAGPRVGEGYDWCKPKVLPPGEVYLLVEHSFKVHLLRAP